VNSTLFAALAATAGTTIALATLVTIIKYAHRAVLRRRGVRTAHYTAAVGEMVSRRMLPTIPPRGWAEDHYFHRVLSDYRLVLSGDDRAFVDRLTDVLGVHEVLVARSRAGLSRTGRLRALSSLVDLGDSRHIAYLRDCLNEDNGHVRVNAVKGLARLGDAASIDRILDLAVSSRPWEAARMADALAEMGSIAVEPISRWIDAARAREKARGVVALGARVLGLIGDPAAEALLIELLASDRPGWRLAAASALQHTGSDKAVAPLLTALQDIDWQVRARAAVALGAVADSVAGPAVAQLLTDEVWWVRQDAAEALLAVPGGTDQLVIALDSPDRFAVDAALNQLTLSGVLGEAADRVAGGAATERDQRLVAKASTH
jgi:HEAT repeat protein